MNYDNFQMKIVIDISADQFVVDIYASINAFTWYYQLPMPISHHKTELHDLFFLYAFITI